MDYRMTTINAQAGEDIVKKINQHLKEVEGIEIYNPTLYFIGFEAISGTKFYLNDQKSPMLVPNNGNFTTPYFGGLGFKIKKLKFENDFSGNVYYII